MANFAADIRRFARITNQTKDQVIASVQLQALTNQVEATAVDTGQAKGGWHTSIGQPSQRVGGPNDPSGASAIARGLQDTLKTGGIFYAVNNLPYILDLEFGRYGDGPKTVNGFSTQSPQGMMRISVIEIKAAIRRTIRDAQR